MTAASTQDDGSAVGSGSNGVAAAPTLPPRPSQSGSGGESRTRAGSITAAAVAASTSPSFAPRTLGPLAVSSNPRHTNPAAPTSRVAQVAQTFEPPPRRPGAPGPGTSSLARSQGSTFNKPTGSAPTSASTSAASYVPPSKPSASLTIKRPGAPSLTPFPSTSATTSSPATVSTPGEGSSSFLPPPTRRYPALSRSSPASSPAPTTASLEAAGDSDVVTRVQALSGNATSSSQTDSVPKLPPRRPPSQPRPSYLPSSSLSQPSKHTFMPSVSTAPQASLSASTASATLLPPPVRTSRALTTSAAGSRLSSPASMSSTMSRSTMTSGRGTPPWTTAAVIEPAARARYEALYDRELAAQASRRKGRVTPLYQSQEPNVQTTASKQSSFRTISTAGERPVLRLRPPPGRGGHHFGPPLRSLSSKDLRADVTAAALSSSAPRASPPTLPAMAKGSESANIKLSPQRTRRIWRKSRLRETFLAKLWDVMGGDADGIARESFVRAMAAIDFELAKRAGPRRNGGNEVGHAQDVTTANAMETAARGRGRSIERTT